MDAPKYAHFLAYNQAALATLLIQTRMIWHLFKKYEGKNWTLKETNG